ncbi:MAG: 2-amino-4-hydroxy-6-hydroxymethyldihydropteridine diphosphokinase [Bacteroidales bacterium]|nr:2-amino-4-hydroxy-6-hydroxymethyldihydropteridine diphosphokinase [Bacteroidales bacterium]
MHEIIILLGSNAGNRLHIFDQTKTFLERLLGPVINSSAIYETEPWGFDADETFLNQVVIFHSEIKPLEVLTGILEIENRFGRQRHGNTYEPRTLDIDILFVGNTTLKSKMLTIPHPKLQMRKFTLVPLAEIIPEFIHPVLKKSVGQLLSECADTGWVKKLEF